MKTLTWTDPKSAEELLRQAQGEEVVVLRHGHPIALLTPLDDNELEWYLRERDPAFIQSIAEARAAIAGGKVTSHEDLKREFGT
jgi:antitoxin (DNA-binding transcriptional repressor) of toxin-antitoxin stability system